MAEITNVDYGITYRRLKISDELFILIPQNLVEGYCTGDTFYSNNKYQCLSSVAVLGEEEIVDSVHSAEDLISIYDYEDLDFLKDYYFNEEKDQLIIVTVKDSQLSKRKFNYRTLLSPTPIETYETHLHEPAITLNNDALESLLNLDEIEKVRNLLLRYKNLISKFRSKAKTGTTRITVENGHVKSIETTSKAPVPKAVPVINKDSSVIESSLVLGKDITLPGLEKYIKERVFGHDEEIRSFAKTILMNYTAIEGEKNEPILLVGPTGTGKTETLRAATEYLNIPFTEVNAANLVPQGIKGMSLEDCLYALIIACNYDVKLAEKGLFLIDETDKLGKINADYKSPVTQILLKFIEGSNFMIDKQTDDYVFNTKMLIKVFAGAFSDLFEEKKSIGFNNTPPVQVFNPKLITKNEYFGKELVTRIPHILVYRELSREEKKRVILSSKLSEYLIKKERYQRQFGVELVAEPSYIDALLDKLQDDEKSMRDLINLIVASVDVAEYEMLSHPTSYRKLVLTKDTVEDNKNFILM